MAMRRSGEEKGERDRTDLAAIIAGAEELPRGGERATEQGESAVRVVGEWGAASRSSSRSGRTSCSRRTPCAASGGTQLGLATPAGGAAPRRSPVSQLRPKARPRRGVRTSSSGWRRAPSPVASRIPPSPMAPAAAAVTRSRRRRARHGMRRSVIWRERGAQKGSMPGDPSILRGRRARQRSRATRLKWRAGLRGWILTRLLERCFCVFSIF
jgi:hypothetical protein